MTEKGAEASQLVVFVYFISNNAQEFEKGLGKFIVIRKEAWHIKTFEKLE